MPSRITNASWRNVVVAPRHWTVTPKPVSGTLDRACAAEKWGGIPDSVGAGRALPFAERKTLAGRVQCDPIAPHATDLRDGESTSTIRCISLEISCQQVAPRRTSPGRQDPQREGPMATIKADNPTGSADDLIRAPKSPQTHQNGEFHSWYNFVWGFSDHLVGGLLD
jgi:hypothetical protein